MPATDNDITLVTSFVSNLLFNRATDKSIKLGVTDLPVLGAFGRLAPADYRKVMRSLAAQPGVAEFVSNYMRTRAADPEIKEVDATVRK